MAERVRTALASCSLDVGGGNSVRITVTLGLVEAGAQDDSTTLIKRAEAALGAAKAAGHNCTYVHAGDACEPVRALLATAV
jgi:PleD family two-component response regulator